MYDVLQEVKQMIINERIQMLRKTMEMTMETFGLRLGVSRSAISNIESGNRGVTDQMFTSIIREFNVNPDWLRNGDGEMFLEPSRNELISSYIDKILKTDNEQNELAVKLIETLAKANSETLDVIYRFCADWIRSVEEGKQTSEIAPAQKESRPLGTPEGVADAEAAYEEALGVVPKTAGSVTNITEGTRGPA